ncbi:MAG: hypothetical protein LUQ22_01675 [Methanotrichaceae archaeon]|nr:hypothetical protein [Methanotrichaceae archaeon]
MLHVDLEVFILPQKYRGHQELEDKPLNAQREHLIAMLNRNLNLERYKSLIQKYSSAELGKIVQYYGSTA